MLDYHAHLAMPVEFTRLNRRPPNTVDIYSQISSTSKIHL